MDRRQFLLSSGATLGGLCFTTRAFAALARGLASQDEFFLQLTVPNGWDVLLATDPWLSAARPDAAELFLDYRADEVARAGELPYGPALAPLKAFLPRVAVINGIFVSKTSVDHIALRNYMTTGSGSGTKAAASVEFLAHQKTAAAWGLVTDAAVPSGDYTIVKSGVSGLSHLSAVDGAVYHDAKEADSPLATAVRDYQGGLTLEQNFQATVRKLRAKEPDPELLRAQLIAGAFRAGLSRAAALTINPARGLNSLDTHTDHAGNHRKSLTDVFRQIAAVLQVLDQTELSGGTSLLSRTTVYVTSEFSRSPALNNSQGKEHNAFTNSAILLGPRVAGGRAIGGTSLIPRAQAKQGDSLHVAQYVNTETGQAIGNPANLGQGSLIRPETVMANLLLAAGVDRARLDGELRGEPGLKTLFRA